jgi:hypothetical protein
MIHLSHFPSSLLLPSLVSLAGGVAPSPTAISHHPTGGGSGQYIKDTLAGPAAADEETPAAPATATEPPTAAAAAAADADLSSAGSELSTDEQLADELFYDTTEPAAEGLADLPNPAAAAAAPEVLPRPSRSYSGEGVGQHEAGPAAAAATQRSGSGGLMFGRAYSGPGLAMQPGVQVRLHCLKVLWICAVSYNSGLLSCLGCIACYVSVELLRSVPAFQRVCCSSSAEVW